MALQTAVTLAACLYFNSWLFEGYDDAKSAILSAILLALGEHKRFGPIVRDGVVRLLKSVNWLRAVRLGLKHIAMPALAAYVTGGASVVPWLAAHVHGLIGPTTDGAGEAHQGEDGATAGEPDWESLIRQSPGRQGPMDVRSFREEFASLLEDSDIESLVVLVDDLDRCSPERVIDNLEAIKLFLSVPGTAFVIGADPRIVRHAIAWRYQQYGERRAGEDSEEEQRLVTDYLEKLIQVPYRLPRLSPAETETYMSLLFCSKLATADRMKECLAACEDQRARNRYAVFGYGAIEQVFGRLPDDLAEALGLSSQAAPLMTEGLKGNPRQIKRFLNALFLRRQLASVAGLANVRMDVLVKLMILEYAHERRFRQLYDWQASQAGHPEQLGQMEAAVEKDEAEGGLESISKDWSSASVRRWLAMAPKLAGVDLRDYFWIARDRLESTLSGVAMVPPIVRRVAELLISGRVAQRNQAMNLIRECTEKEIDLLLGLLNGQITRQPGSKESFTALRMLAEGDVPGAAATLASILGSVPLKHVPASIGMDLSVLLKKKAELVPTFKEATERLRDSPDTMIGKAFLEGENT